VTPTQAPVQAPKLEDLAKTAPKQVEAVEVVPEPVDDDTPKDFEMAIPGKEAKYFETAEDFADAYNDLMLAVRRADKLAPATRRTKLKELEQANEISLDRLSPELREELKEKRLQYNKGLSLEEKEGADG